MFTCGAPTTFFSRTSFAPVGVGWLSYLISILFLQREEPYPDSKAGPFFRNLLPEIQGIAPLQIVSLLIFFTIFTAVIIMVVRMGRQHVNHMKNLPLDLEDNGSLTSGENHHG